jgi:hypothetical protein
MVGVQAIHNGEQICRAGGASRDKSPSRATWMDECSTEDGAVHGPHNAVMSLEAAKICRPGRKFLVAEQLNVDSSRFCPRE